MFPIPSHMGRCCAIRCADWSDARFQKSASWKLKARDYIQSDSPLLCVLTLEIVNSQLEFAAGTVYDRRPVGRPWSRIHRTFMASETSSPQAKVDSFLRRCGRNFVIGTALSIIPGGAFYAFVFPYTTWQLGVLSVLALLDLAAFLPVDLFILRWSLAPVRCGFRTGATAEDRRRAMARLLDSPRLVILRIFGPHAIAASAGITLLVIAANRYMGLGISSSTFPIYWLLNLTVVPIAHAVYEYAAMEREVQPLALELATEIRPEAAGAPAFTLDKRMRVFFPLLALAPIVIVVSSIFLREWAIVGAISTRVVRDVVAIGAACAVLFLFLMHTLGAQLREQTGQLIAALDRLGRGDLSVRAQLYTTSEFGQIAGHINNMAVSLNERQRLRDLFGAYMTTEVADALLSTGDSQTGRTERRFVAILFVDIRGFTEFSRDRSPETVVSVLNEFLETTVEAIAASGGTVNKYLGDGLLAIFGAPVALPNPSSSAIAASLDIVHRVEELNRTRAPQVPALRIGIGIHAGEVVVGSIGAPRYKLEYTVIGDPVNVTSRIEQLNKKLGTEILVSEEAFTAAGAQWQPFAGAPLSEQVKGIESAVTVYPLRAAAKSAP